MSLKNKISSIDLPKALYENRYCNQEGFSILVFGGQDKNYEVTNQVLEIKIPSFQVTKFPPMVKPHNRLRATTINSEIFAIVEGKNVYEKLGNFRTSVEIYSEETKSWKHQYINFEERIGCCICSFMGKLYIIGGWNKSRYESDCSCFTYDIIENFIKIADLNVTRRYRVCKVFEGKIVVTTFKL